MGKLRSSDLSALGRAMKCRMPSTIRRPLENQPWCGLVECMTLAFDGAHASAGRREEGGPLRSEGRPPPRQITNRLAGL